MYDRMQTFSQEDLSKIHQAAMELLSSTGVVFNEEEALSIFKSHGHKIEGQTVFFSEEQVMRAVDSAPTAFELMARNPEHNRMVGGDDFVLLPGYGAPFVDDPQKGQRPATLADYHNFAKLTQSSEHLDMCGFMMVEPHDISPKTGHLDMLLSNFTLSDKAMMACTVDREATKDMLNMLAMIFGGRDALMAKPATVGLINTLSPLKYSSEMAGALIELARGGQAALIAAMIMAGASGPVQLPGVLVLQTAEILAGLVLAQLVRPGTPVIYGSTSSVVHMRTGGPTIGAPELWSIISANAQIARFYGLPSRSGGSLTDAHITDAQAGLESAMALSTAMRNGINFILHSAGIMGTYIAMSFEKFMIDEEVCGMLRRALKPMAVNDETMDLETIKQVGHGGQYLTHPKTFQLCRTEFYMPKLMYRDAYGTWVNQGRLSLGESVGAALSARLEGYVKPDLDPSVERDLESYVARRQGK